MSTETIIRESWDGLGIREIDTGWIGDGGTTI